MRKTVRHYILAGNRIWPFYLFHKLVHSQPFPFPLSNSLQNPIYCGPALQAPATPRIQRPVPIRTPVHRSRVSSKMSGANSPEILAAYDAVRSDKDETNWLLISYAAPTGNALALTGTGTGGLEELASKLDDSQAQYA